MKKIFGLCAFLFSTLSVATTLTPVQLLNPSGSTSGQSIVSTGSGSAPGWASVPLSGLTSIASNTVLANASASSSAPAAFAMPSCSTSASALQWSSGTGFVCNTAVNAATLGGATFASPPAAGYGSSTPEPVFATTLSATALITPASAIGIKGTTAADSAQAGSVGEYLSNSTGGAAITSGTASNATTLTLTAGDWDVQGVVAFTPAGTTVMQLQGAGINTTSATFPAYPNGTSLNFTAAAGSGSYVTTPVVRVNVSTSTTVYLVQTSVFTTSTAQAAGFIRARRVR